MGKKKKPAPKAPSPPPEPEDHYLDSVSSQPPPPNPLSAEEKELGEINCMMRLLESTKKFYHRRPPQDEPGSFPCRWCGRLDKPKNSQKTSLVRCPTCAFHFHPSCAHHFLNDRAHSNMALSMNTWNCATCETIKLHRAPPPSDPKELEAYKADMKEIAQKAREKLAAIQGHSEEELKEGLQTVMEELVKSQMQLIVTTLNVLQHRKNDVELKMEGKKLQESYMERGVQIEELESVAKAEMRKAESEANRTRKAYSQCKESHQSQLRGLAAEKKVREAKISRLKEIVDAKREQLEALRLERDSLLASHAKAQEKHKKRLEASLKARRPTRLDLTLSSTKEELETAQEELALERKRYREVLQERDEKEEERANAEREYQTLGKKIARAESGEKKLQRKLDKADQKIAQIEDDISAVIAAAEEMKDRFDNEEDREQTLLNLKEENQKRKVKLDAARALVNSHKELKAAQRRVDKLKKQIAAIPAFEPHPVEVPSSSTSPKHPPTPLVSPPMGGHDLPSAAKPCPIQAKAESESSDSEEALKKPPSSPTKPSWKNKSSKLSATGEGQGLFNWFTNASNQLSSPESSVSPVKSPMDTIRPQNKKAPKWKTLLQSSTFDL